MLDTLLKLLNVKDEERDSILLLLAHSFFIGIFLAFFFSYASGAFLGEFDAKMLPYAYIATGLTGYAASTIFGSLQQKISYPKLLMGTLSVLLVLMVLFYIGVILTDAAWLIFVIYVWIIPFYTMIALQYWSMVMKLFDLRQGKRLFGLIGSGDVISSLIGFSSVPLILSAFKGSAEILLLLGTIGLAIGIFLQWKIIKRFSSQLTTAKVGHKKAKRGALRDVFRNKYYTLIFFLTICSVFGQNFVDYNFMGLARANFERGELIAFFGIFFAIVKVVELLGKTVLAGRLLNQYGLRLGLSVLPTLLLAFSLIALVASPWDATVSLMFIPMAMNKLFDRAARKSLDEPSVKILYQPLDANTKLMVQTQAEGKSKQIAIIASGILLIIFGYIPGFGIFESTLFLCLVLVAWLMVSARMYKAYRSVIEEKLAGDELKNSKNRNPIGVRFLAKELESDSPARIIAGLQLAERIESGVMESFLERLLMHPAIEVRRTVTDIILQNKILPISSAVQKAAEREQDEELKDHLINTQIALEQIKALRVEDVSLLARDTEFTNREVASVWLEYNDHPQRLLLLRELASDKNIRVATAAIKSSAAIKSVELWALLIEFIPIASLSNATIPALVAEGEDVVPVLEIAFDRFEGNPLVLSKIIQICGRIGGERSISFLSDKIYYPNREVQLLAIDMLVLNRHTATAEQGALIKVKIEEEASYCTWLIASIIDLSKETKSFRYLVRKLKEELKYTVNNIFNLLAIVYDTDSIQRVQQNLERNTKESVALAMEMIDILLNDRLKAFVTPIIDTIPLSDKLIKLVEHFPQKRYTKVIDRLKDVIYKDFSKVNRWIKACAIQQLMKVSTDVHAEIEALVFHDDFFLKETALVAIHHADPQLYHYYTSKERKRDKIKYDRVTGYNRKLERIPSNYQEISYMQRNEFLETLPEILLVKLSELAEQEYIEVGEAPDYKYLKGNRVHFVVEGSFELGFPDGTTKQFKQGDAIGLLDDVDMEKCQFKVLSNTKIFYMNKDAFYAIAQVHQSLVEAIYFSLIQDEEQAVKEEKEYEDMNYVGVGA
ncbi:MAG: hypothetical protein ACPGJS_09645 [Flammeovirgaceae bacterium]